MWILDLHISASALLLQLFVYASFSSICFSRCLCAGTESRLVPLAVPHCSTATLYVRVWGNECRMLQSCAHSIATRYSCFSHSNFKWFLLSCSCVTVPFYLYFNQKFLVLHTLNIFNFSDKPLVGFFPCFSGCCSNLALTLHNSHSFHISPSPVFCHPSWNTCATLMLWTPACLPTVPQPSWPVCVHCTLFIQFLLFSQSCLVSNVALPSNMAHGRTACPFLWKAA